MSFLDEKTYETGDIVLAAALKCLGYKLVNIERIGNKGIFALECDKDIINEYELGSLRVEPQAFNAAIRSLTTATKRRL